MKPQEKCNKNSENDGLLLLKLTVLRLTSFFLSLKKFYMVPEMTKILSQTPVLCGIPFFATAKQIFFLLFLFFEHENNFLYPRIFLPNIHNSCHVQNAIFFFSYFIYNTNTIRDSIYSSSVWFIFNLQSYRVYSDDFFFLIHAILYDFLVPST